MSEQHAVAEEYLTKSGKILTDEDIEKFADEAEAGYELVRNEENNLDMWVPNQRAVLDPPLKERPTVDVAEARKCVRCHRIVVPFGSLWTIPGEGDLGVRCGERVPLDCHEVEEG